MNDLPCNVLKLITNNLGLQDFKNLSFCSKYLYKSISSLYQNEKQLPCQLNNKDIHDIYDDIKSNHDVIGKTKQNYSEQIQYDIDWCFERFHSERYNKKQALTYEQKNIISAKFKPGDIILIQAFAGTGKTSTLLNVAKVNLTAKILYLTFNKSLSDYAKTINIPNTKICTMHSLALSTIDPDQTYDIGKLSSKYASRICLIIILLDRSIPKYVSIYFELNLPISYV